MIINFDAKGNLQLTAQNIAESNRILDYVSLTIKSYEKSPKVSAESKPAKKHKKHNHVKVCEYCGKGYKGLIGLGIHKNKCGKRIISSSTNPSNVFVTSSSSNV